MRFPCQQRGRASTSLLAEPLSERTAPELAHLESRLAALMSSGLTLDLLAEILPLGQAAKPRIVPLSCCSGVSSRQDRVYLRARDFVGKTGRRIDARC